MGGDLLLLGIEVGEYILGIVAAQHAGHVTSERLHFGKHKPAFFRADGYVRNKIEDTVTQLSVTGLYVVVEVQTVPVEQFQEVDILHRGVWKVVHLATGLRVPVIDIQHEIIRIHLHAFQRVHVLHHQVPHRG